MSDCIFLTFLIITYRRPKKAERLLRCFLDERWEGMQYLGLEIVIADDHSCDNTKDVLAPIVAALIDQGWEIKYVCRSTNLRGDRNLYWGYTRDSQGDYVWFLCDDDVIDTANAVPFIQSIALNRPVAALCGFLQGNRHQFGNFLGGRPRIISDFWESINFLAKYPKTTAYALKRIPSLDLDSLFNRWDGTLFSWIGIAILLRGKFCDGPLLVYPPICATADEDYGELRYSFRVFLHLESVVRDALVLCGEKPTEIRLNIPWLKEKDEIELCLQGLQSHYSCRSEILYERAVLEKELQFLKANLAKSFLTKNRFLTLLKLLIFYFYSVFRGMLPTGKSDCVRAKKSRRKDDV